MKSRSKLALLTIRRSSPSAIAVRLGKLFILIIFCFTVSTLTTYIASVMEDERSIGDSLKYTLSEMKTPSVFKGLSTKDPEKILDAIGLKMGASYDQENVSVLALTYPGGGVDVLEQSLAVLPNVFYLNDPLINLLYPALYGVRGEGTVPFNVLMDHQGTIRRFPRTEAYESMKLLKNFLDCKFSRLPVRMLMNPYWSSQRQKVFSRFTQCARGYGAHLSPPQDSLSTCERAISGVCPSVFSLNPNMGYWRILNCSAIFYTNNSFTEEALPEIWAQFDAKAPIQRSQTKFNTYFVCVKSFEEKVRSCAAAHLDDVCKQSPIKVITGSTITMYVTQQLMKMYPKMHFIHLLRDPRALAHQRLRLGPTDGQFATFEQSNALSLAKSYCRIAYDHMMAGIRIKKENAGRVIGLSYDKIMYNITHNMFSLMKHLRINPTPEGASRVMDFISLEGHDLVRNNFRWPIALPSDEVSAINEECGALLDEMTRNTKSLSVMKHKYVI